MRARRCRRREYLSSSYYEIWIKGADEAAAGHAASSARTNWRRPLAAPGRRRRRGPAGAADVAGRAGARRPVRRGRRRRRRASRSATRVRTLEHQPDGPHAAAALCARQAGRDRARARRLRLPRQQRPLAGARTRNGVYTVRLRRAGALGRGRRPDAQRRRSTAGSPIWSPRLSATDALPPSPAQRCRDPLRRAAAPVFREPWEAQAFAMAVALHERGLFTWTRMGGRAGGGDRPRRPAGDPDTRRDLLPALAGGAGTAGGRQGRGEPRRRLAERRDAWDRAARATPHGQPILLENDPRRGAGEPRGCPGPATVARRTGLAGHGGGRPRRRDGGRRCRAPDLSGADRGVRREAGAVPAGCLVLEDPDGTACAATP